MSRDGRPSRLKDLRLFGGDAEREAEAFGRRLAWWLNGEGFSIGHEPALYVILDPGLPDGETAAKPPRFTPHDWWFREVTVGCPDSDDPDAASAAIVSSLRALRPDAAQVIDRAAQTVLSAGDGCRFLLKTTETASAVVEVSTTIGTWRNPSLLYAGITEKATGTYREAGPVELSFYDNGVLLAGQVKATRTRVRLVPRTSTPAQIVAQEHGGGVSWRNDDFTDAERPATSGLLVFR